MAKLIPMNSKHLKFFQNKFTVERLNLVLDLVKQETYKKEKSKTSLYPIVTLISHYYPDNLNIAEFERFLHSPGYNRKDKMIYPSSSIYLRKYLLHILIIHLYISGSHLAEKLLEEEIIRALIDFNQRVKLRRGIFKFIKRISDSLKQLGYYESFRNTIMEKAGFMKVNDEMCYRDFSRKYILYDYFLLITKEEIPQSFSITELYSYLDETQASIAELIKN